MMDIPISISFTTKPPRHEYFSNIRYERRLQTLPIIEMFYTVQSQGLNIEFQSLMEARVNLKMIN